MRVSNSTWRAGALGVVAIVAIGNVILAVHKTLPPPVDSPVIAVDPVTRQERRLAKLRQSLAARGVEGVVGYLGDSAGPALWSDPGQVEDYYLAQFVLVPLVLEGNSERSEWAVANLRTTAASARVGPDWKIAEDFGDGVFLLRKAKP